MKSKHLRRIKTICTTTLMAVTPLLASTLVQASDHARNQTGATTKAAPTTSNKSSKAWAPSPFDTTAQTLPRNYTGLDTVKFFQLFKDRVSKAVKGEFETTQQFEDRLANKASLLAPIDPEAVYAFKMERWSFEYDADNQAYSVGGKYGVQFAHAWNEKAKQWSYYTTAAHYDADGTKEYTGTNAYGASVGVKSYSGTYFSLALPDGHSALMPSLENPSRTTYRYLRHNLSASIEKAKQLQGKPIGALMVGNIADTVIIKGKGFYKAATLSDPNEFASPEIAIPFNLKMIIYYVIATGEILEKQSFE